MKKLINLISEEVTKAFVSAGYDEKYGKVTLSNRPDLCEFQCNGAMAAAKEYKCAPFMISDKVAALLESDEMFESVESVKPGFLCINTHIISIMSHFVFGKNMFHIIFCKLRPSGMISQQWENIINKIFLICHRSLNVIYL